MTASDPKSGDGGESTFTVRDRRQFTAEGDRKGDAPPVESAPPPPPIAPPRTAKAAEPPPQAVPRPGAEEPPRKRSLRERILGRKDRELESQGAPGAMPPDDSADEINFPNFVLSLMTQTLMHLGEIPDPMTQKAHRDLGLAKQTIDLIALLQAKTKGNLSADEDQLLAEVLYKLRMLFVDVSRAPN